MHDYIIEAMVEALKPTLKNPGKAKQILDRFWRDKMALVWDVQDVHTAANEREVALTNRRAIKVLLELYHYHNKQTGLQWKDVTCYIEEYALGRKLTKAELKRFVNKNILTIDRKNRKRRQPTNRANNQSTKGLGAFVCLALFTTSGTRT
jgi:hypothetical protein